MTRIVIVRRYILLNFIRFGCITVDKAGKIKFNRG